MCNKDGTVIVDPAIPGGSYVLQDLLDDINAFAYSDIPEPMIGACDLKERLDRPINNFLIELEVAITVAELNYFLPGFDLCYDGNCDPLFVRTILQNAEAEYIERRDAFLAAKPESCGSTCETLDRYSGGGGGGGTGFE